MAKPTLPPEPRLASKAPIDVELVEQPSYAPRARALEQCVPDVDCKDCPNQEAGGPVLPLCLVKAGKRAVVDRVYEGQRFRKRLADLGLATGMELHVLRASYGSGPMIVAIRNDARLALGWGMANKIHVRLVE
ncbi:FeoA family protein [Aggregatilinea lenta]|uniref:FeoA family protein n=1 Tax=Aggregatilinea lenta TaxID=913108 RepID=UPI0013C2ADB5|nr:FeoA family protein [Aggregatilinea lenta]